jgi:ATP-binding cassette subfamily F protein 3
MAVLIASGLRKEFSGTVLFDGVGFKVERADRLALAGPNGAGKTTLLRALAGEVSVEGGELAFEKGSRIALHDQRPPATSDRPLREYVLAGTSDLAAVEAELRSLEGRMAAGEHDAAMLRRYSEAQARLEHAGGYDWRDRAASVVRGLGFSDDDLDRPLTTFSGGELTRASLARALASQPDLLLLDEPTNHLDIESLEWLEGMLRTLDAAVILVAHDRWFLEAVTTAVLELEKGKSIYFPGAWHVWRREQAARDIHQAKTAVRQAERIARLERFVERFRYKNTKARQAQSKLKQIDRIRRDQVHAPDHRKKVLGFEFLKPARSGRDVAVVEKVVLRAGDKELLDGASFAIERGEHVALVGPNGSGKTTLLETLLGLRTPGGGHLRLGHGVEPAYFSQHEAELDERGSVLEAAMSGTGLKRPEAQKLLGQFLFSGWDEHEKPVVALSGGERRRLALAIVVASGANFLVLDEPTNHLDLESRESLERALEAFPGTVLLVSHDRAVLDAVATRLLAVEHKAIASYPGGWADYVSAQEPDAPEAPTLTPAPKAKPKPKPKPKKQRAPRVAKAQPSALELVEREVARAEARVNELEARLADDWSDMALLSAHREAREDLEALLARWESLFEGSGSQTS